MPLREFIYKQHIDGIQWTQEEGSVPAALHPKRDLEIHRVGRLTVRESPRSFTGNAARRSSR